MANTAAAMVAKAASQIGIHEGRDPDGNWNNLNPFGAWYAAQVGNPSFNGVAWCDEFVSWCAAMTGNGDIIPKSAWVPGRLAYYRNKGQSGVFPPKPGDIGILFHNGSAVHVFLVEKWLGNGFVQTIEGNTNDNGSPQGNGVYRLQRADWATNPNIVYCRPSYVTAPAPLPPIPNVGHGGSDAPPPAPAPAPKPPVKPPVAKPPVAKPIPAPGRFNGSPILLLHDENLRLGKRSATAQYFNTRLWSWLYWQGGNDGRAFCQGHYAAWMKEPASLYGPTALAATQALYAILNKRDPKNWPAKGTISPAPTYPGPALLRVLGFRADS